VKRRAEARNPPETRRYLLAYPGVLVPRVLSHCKTSNHVRCLVTIGPRPDHDVRKTPNGSGLNYRTPRIIPVLPAGDRHLTRTPAHQNDENDGTDDRDEDRTDTTETIAEESEHNALSCAEDVPRLFL
jgi:hypothetical protein